MSNVKNKNLLAYLALGVVCIFWGTTYLGIRIGVQYLPPFLFAAIRQVIAGSALAGGMLLFSKVSFPSKKHLMLQAVGGFLLITIGNGLVSWSEVRVSSGLAAIICSLMPVWMILLNLIINPADKPNLGIIMGTLICIGGIVLIFGEHLSDFLKPEYAFGVVFIFVANIGWALGSIYMKKRNQQSNPFLDAGLQMFFGGIWLFFFSFALDSYDAIQWTSDGVYALMYLIVFGSIAAYACYSYALKHLPMPIVSLYAYVNPIVAVLLGWWVLDEALSLRILLASLVTVAGIYIVNRGYQNRNALKPQLSGGRTV